MENERETVVSRRDLALLGAVVAVGVLLRVWWVGVAPLHPDEFHYAYNMMAAEETQSLAAIRDLDTRFLVERRTAHPLAWSALSRWLWFLPLGWAVPWSPGFLRLSNVVMGSLLIPLSWGIVHMAGDRRAALAAAGLVAFCPGLVWIARTLYHDSAFTVWVAVMLLGGAWALRSSTRWTGLAVGLGMGLALATKISAPMLAPAFVMLACAGARDLPLWRRMERLLLAFAVALGLFLLFCDPAAYWSAIRQPSDPRYHGSISLAKLDHTFIGDLDVLLNIVVLDLPGTVLLCVLAAALAWRHTRPAFPVMLLVTLGCLSPLILLHMPPLSGPHGFAPLYFVLCLLGAGMVAMQPRLAMLGLLSASAGVAFTLIVAREVGGLDRVARAGVYPPRDALYTAVRDDLHQRHEPRQILVAGDTLFFRAQGIIRLAELTQGAVVLTPAHLEEAISADAWSLADVAIVQRGVALPPPDIRLFRHVGIGGDFDVWRRESGATRREFTVADLERVGEGEYLLPGGMRIAAGRIAINGDALPRTLQSEAPVTMDGRMSFADWRSGRILVREEAGDVKLKLVSPLMDDVFWDY